MGPAGQCASTGQMIVNGTMESVSNNKPTGWTFVNSAGISSVTAQGRVHSGNYAVNIGDDSSISQTIPLASGGCFYLLSFFARGEGAQAGFEANIVFLTPTGNVSGGNIMVRRNDLTTANAGFSFYQLITSRAPINATGITLSITVDADGSQSIDVDDVSLTVI